MLLTARAEPFPSPSRAPAAKHAGGLEAAEELRLLRRVQAQDDPRALARVVGAHAGLVVRIAREFHGPGATLEDLIQEGNLGLTIAIRRFDPTRGVRLGTYAAWWIRACVIDYVVRTHGPVRIGTTRGQRRVFFGLGRARRRLEQAGATVDAASLASEIGVPEEDVASMLPRLSSRDLSLDTPISDDGVAVGERLAGEAPSAEDLLGAGQLDRRQRARLREGLRQLDPREREILRARHLCARPQTLGAIGRRLGVSRERVPQLEARAKERLRSFCDEGEANG